MFLNGEKLESGHYTIVKELGQGGMGMVYLCHDELLQRDVAIKMLLPELTTNRDTLEGFIQEARLAAQLEHPNVVTIFEIGKEERQSKLHHYMVMEYLTGGNLASRINSKQLSIEHCLNWMKQLANGMAYAHKRGIVHQDIKADNIFITTEGDLKIGDFGLARLAAGRAKGRSGHHGMGTPAYMSPELCRGDPQDHRSDIYSMGILFYEMATGQLPFKAKGMIEMAMKHASAPVPSARKLNPLVPEVLDKLIHKMMAKQPGDRYQSMAEVVSILDDLIFELRVARLGLGPKPGAKGSGFFQPRTEPEPIVESPAQTESQEQPLPAVSPKERDSRRDKQEPIVLDEGFDFAQASFPAFGVKAAVESDATAMPPGVAVNASSTQTTPAAPAPVIPRQHLELLWGFHSFGPVGWAAQPIATKEGVVVYCVSADGNCYALDASAGSKLWNFETRGPVLSSPVLTPDKLFLTSTDGRIYALSPKTGSLKWMTEGEEPIVAPPALHNDYLLAGDLGGGLVALSSKDGHAVWHCRTGDAIVSRPEVVPPSVFVACKDEHLYAVDIGTGAVRWRFRANSPLVAAPIASVDSVYLGATDGSFYALDVETGRLIWQYDTAKSIVARAVIHFTTVIFCSQDRWLYCCEKYDGRLLWKAALRGRVVANLVSHSGLVYVVTREGWVQCFETRTGELKWHMDTKRRLEAPPLVTDEALCLGTVDGDILAYRLVSQ